MRMRQPSNIKGNNGQQEDKEDLNRDEKEFDN